MQHFFETVLGRLCEEHNSVAGEKVCDRAELEAGWVGFDQTRDGQLCTFRAITVDSVQSDAGDKHNDRLQAYRGRDASQPLQISYIATCKV